MGGGDWILHRLDWCGGGFSDLAVDAGSGVFTAGAGALGCGWHHCLSTGTSDSQTHGPRRAPDQSYADYFQQFPSHDPAAGYDGSSARSAPVIRLVRKPRAR